VFRRSGGEDWTTGRFHELQGSCWMVSLREKQSIKSTRHIMADLTDDDPATSPLAE
jgi:hypothetical protein